VTLLTTQDVAAQGCRNIGIYTDYGKDRKPSVFVWNGNARPDPSKLTLRFRYLGGWNNVRKDDWGVRLDAPWQDGVNANGWTGYFIAQRWYSFQDWDNDSRWQAIYCG
jgi:hypothetical protein